MICPREERGIRIMATDSLRSSSASRVTPIPLFYARVTPIRPRSNSEILICASQRRARPCSGSTQSLRSGRSNQAPSTGERNHLWPLHNIPMVPLWAGNQGQQALSQRMEKFLFLKRTQTVFCWLPDKLEIPGH